MYIDTQFETRLARDTALLALYDEILPKIERAEDIFLTAQKRNTGANKAEDLHAQVGRLESRMLALDPGLDKFPEAMPERNWRRKIHCRRMWVFFSAGRDALAAAKAGIEEELEAARAQEKQAQEDLREMRCLILEDAMAVPAYVKEWDATPEVRHGEAVAR